VGESIYEKLLIGGNMEQLLTNLEPMLAKLSEVFCVSVDAIRENAMQYILMYGKYELIVSITSWSFWFTFISLGMFGTFALTIFSLNSEDEVDWKKIIIITLSITIGLILLHAIGECICYLASPEIYSIREVIRLIQ